MDNYGEQHLERLREHFRDQHMKNFKEALDNFRVGEMVRLRDPMYFWMEIVIQGTIAGFDERSGYVIIHPINVPGHELKVSPGKILKMNPAGGRRSRKSRKSLRKSKKSKISSRKK